MKKLLIGTSLSLLALAGCGTQTIDVNESSDAVLTFACPAEWPLCEVTDAETGNVNYVIDAANGIGGNTMGPLVTADSTRDAKTLEEAKQKITAQFQLTNESEIRVSGIVEPGREFIVFDNKLNPGQTTYAQVYEKETSYFACIVSGAFETAEDAQVQGEEACANMN